MGPQRNRRPGFSRRAQYGLFIGYVVAVLGALIGAVMLLLSTFNPAAFAAVRGVMREVTTPVSSGLAWMRSGIGSLPDNASRYVGVAGENDRLRKQIAEDQALVQRARTLAQENRRLRVLLQVRDRESAPVVAARLVSSSASSTRRFAILNAGSRQGVQPGQPVRGPEGLIGRVVEVSPNTARVLLVIDPESVVPVRRTRDGLAAIVSGRGDGLVDIKSASIASVPLLAGDTFVTSGVGGIYPPNIPVARVLKSARDSAEARMFASPDGLDFALVLAPYLPPSVVAGGPPPVGGAPE